MYYPQDLEKASKCSEPQISFLEKCPEQIIIWDNKCEDTLQNYLFIKVGMIMVELPFTNRSGL